MTSICGEYAQIPDNKLYIATGSVTLLTSTGATTQVSVQSGTVLRDMGTTVVLASGDILRKVQQVPTTGSSDPYTSGYIKLGGATYGGDGSGTSSVVRLN